MKPEVLWVHHEFAHYRSTPPELLLWKGALKICSKLTGKQPCQSAISKNNFLEITFQHGCSPVNLLHIFRTSFPQNTFEVLLLSWVCLRLIVLKLATSSFLRECINTYLRCKFDYKTTLHRRTHFQTYFIWFSDFRPTCC